MTHDTRYARTDHRRALGEAPAPDSYAGSAAPKLPASAVITPHFHACRASPEGHRRLLCPSRGRLTFAGVISGVVQGDGVRAVCWVADKTGGAAPGGGQALMRSRPAGQGGSGDGRESLAGQHGCGSRLEGQAVPGAGGSAACAEVGAGLAGDVALEAADDLLLRQSLRGAPSGVGAGGRVRAHAGEHDPPQGVVGLPVTARVERRRRAPPMMPGSARRRTGAPRLPRCAAAQDGPRPR